MKLVPTFRSSCFIAAPIFTNFGKSWALANLLILVPLYRSEVPDRIRRLWCRDFRSAVLVAKLLIVVPLIWLTSAPALALDDTPANRAAEADYYLRVVPPQSRMNDRAAKLAATLPEGKRATFVALMTKNLDINAVAALMRDSMIKNFTADELKALADFYGSPVGRSAMAKMGNYMADSMPRLVVELQKAQALTQQQMQAH